MSIFYAPGFSAFSYPEQMSEQGGFASSIQVETGQTNLEEKE
jgi:hypothetical protein